ncbi:unnamed protein product [Chrysoparadoxa australica]
MRSLLLLACTLHLLGVEGAPFERSPSSLPWLHSYHPSGHKVQGEGLVSFEILRGGATGPSAATAAPLSLKSLETRSSIEVRGGQRKLSVAWPVMTAFLYYLALAFTIPVLPKIVNGLMGEGTVTGGSATLYGLLTSIDAGFTLLTTKFHATLSDTYGRKPFMLLSALGLGIGFCITGFSGKIWALMLAAAIDGCTSCMYSIAHASVIDVAEPEKLSEAFGLFQGLALGMAFMFGLPLGGIIGAKKGYIYPFIISISLCLLNALQVLLIMPETLSTTKRAKKVDWANANPWGALQMISRSKLIAGVTICWMLMWVAHAGLQINFINYTELKFAWTTAQSGASLAMLGLLVAVLPKLIIPRLGLSGTICAVLPVYALSQLMIAVAPAGNSPTTTTLMYMGLALSAVGTVSFPAMLAVLNQQVGDTESGAMQGAADTVKTLTTMVASPAMAGFFGYFISEKAPRKIIGANYYAGAAFALLAFIAAESTFRYHARLGKRFNGKIPRQEFGFEAEL